MPDVTITIGGRNFPVACQEGEEAFLKAAAQMLDTEAAVVMGQIGRLPAERMLLMAGLLLADKTLAKTDQLDAAETKIKAMEETLAKAEDLLRKSQAKIAELEAAKPPAEVAVIPAQVVDGLAELAARAEALAERIEEPPAPEAKTNQAKPEKSTADQAPEDASDGD
ncbi:cell division protein ZapA [Rhodobacteraceae bacterium XHP0102]|nr:cell division protein ZapA [Rhodobacteraceae bacterium XHP0102]